MEYKYLTDIYNYHFLLRNSLSSIGKHDSIKSMTLKMPFKWSIVPSSIEDVTQIASMVYTSKLQLTINRLLYKNWPNELSQRSNYTKAVESSFNDPLSETWKAINNEGKEILGYVVLTRKRPVGNEDDTNQRTRVEDGGRENVPEYFHTEVVHAVEAAVKEIRKDRDTFEHFGSQFTCTSTVSDKTASNKLSELTHIFIDPAHRKKGIGSQLLELCIERARAENLRLALDSEPQIHGFFLKHGLVDTDYVDIDLTKWAPPHCGFGVFRLWGMAFQAEA